MCKWGNAISVRIAAALSYLIRAGIQGNVDWSMRSMVNNALNQLCLGFQRVRHGASNISQLSKCVYPAPSSVSNFSGSSRRKYS